MPLCRCCGSQSGEKRGTLLEHPPTMPPPSHENGLFCGFSKRFLIFAGRPIFATLPDPHTSPAAHAGRARVSNTR